MMSSTQSFEEKREQTPITITTLCPGVENYTPYCAVNFNLVEWICFLNHCYSKSNIRIIYDFFEIIIDSQLGMNG